MAKQKAVRDFVLEAIKGLSKEEFDELVRIFQTSWWHNSEVVNVDGPNDGGTDIKVYQDKKEQKKCIQVTIQKKSLGVKLKNDLKKVSTKISKYGYSNRFEFYCSSTVLEENIEEYKKIALEEYDIVLELFDAKRLAQIKCKDVTDYIYSLHSDVVLKPEQMNIDRATKTLYDLLANGKDSSDIKNSLVDSVIISILFEKAPIELSELKSELESRLGKAFPDILHFINILKTDQIIIKDPDNPQRLRLSDIEYDNVKDILANSLIKEKEFCDSFSEILEKYQIEYTDEILYELKNLYKFKYSNDIDNSSKNEDKNEESAYSKIFDSFKKYLLELIDNKDSIDLLIDEIKNLCSKNNYLNKISASESFLSLYKSNQLELYLNQKHKDIYLDTPTFVYLICDYYGIDKNDWENPFYRSTKSLIRLKESYPEKISFFITQNYLGEVVGEIKKALIFSQFENYPFFKDMGGTRNSLFNYYEYLKESKLFDDDEIEIEHFNDFIFSLGFDNTNPNDARFYKDTLTVLNQIAEDFDIQIINWSQNDRYGEFKTFYEKELLKKGKNKTDTAIRNDVNQVLTLFDHDTTTDCYLATWDTTIHLLRDKFHALGEYRYFNICNPAKLSNKIALENFNIDESALTNEIFAYADKRYDISNRVKSLLELIAPFLNEKGSGCKKLLKKLGRIRKEQIEQRGTDIENIEEEKNLPVEEIILLLIPNKEKEKEDNTIIEKFSLFMSSEENTDYIINVINQISQLKDYKSYDFTEYYEKIKSVDLSTQLKNQ